MQPDATDDREHVFLTLGEVARMLRVDEGEVALLLESGELPGIRIGTRSEWRIERRILDTWLEAKYEESRRSALWQGFDYGSLADLDPAPRSRPERPGESAPSSSSS